MPSAVIAAIEYDMQSSTLKVTYVSGTIYHYKNVPEKIYVALKTSFSKGAFLNQHIKGKYSFEKIR